MSDERELPGPERELPGSDELRALYRRLAPPPLADDVAEADAETARVVRWVQGAYRGLEPARASVPLLLARTRRPARFGPRARLAAAAAVLLVAGAALWRALSGSSPAPAPERVAQSPSGPGSAVEVIDVRPDGLELRSGPVRLLLLEPPPSEPTDEPPRTR